MATIQTCILCKETATGQSLTSILSSLPLTISTLCDVELETIQSISGDLVIADMDCCGSSLFPFTNRMNLKNPQLRWIVLSSTRSEALLYEAMKHKVDDFLLKPLDPSTVVASVEQSINDLMRLRSQVTFSASRWMFMKYTVNELETTPLSIPTINSRFGIHFQEGRFKACILKMDCKENVMCIFENDDLRDRLAHLVTSHCDAYCYDIVVDKLSDCVLALFNYHPKYQAHMQKALNALFSQAKQEFSFHGGISLTLCISKEYEDIAKLPEIKAQVLDARWSRMKSGIGRVIYSKENRDGESLMQREYLLHLGDEIFQAFEALDIERGKKYINDFFTLNKTFLGTREARLFIRRLIDRLFDLYFDITNTNNRTDGFRKKHEFIYFTNTANSFDQLAFIVTSQVSQILTDISSQISQMYSKPVRNAIQYINEHYCSVISLQLVADEVQLNATYLSNLFRKETGQTFIEFVKGKKINFAKQLLREKNGNISYVASKLEYDDVRNFSKFFKKNVGITPTDYQKIYCK